MSRKTRRDFLKTSVAATGVAAGVLCSDNVAANDKMQSDAAYTLTRKIPVDIT